MADSKLIFFDIDGTIWDYKEDIPESTVEALVKLKEKGHKRFLCTGRGKSFVREKKLLDLGFDGMVTGCGTLVECQGKVVHRALFGNDRLANLITYLEENRLKVLIEAEDKIYLDEEDWVDDYYVQYVISKVGPYIRPLRGTWMDWERAGKISCECAQADMEKVAKKLKEDYEIMLHAAPVVEITPKGNHKGSGIRTMVDFLGVDMEDTIAVGDSYNDLPMMESACLSIAMGDAPEDVKCKCDHVTSGIYEDGIYNACKHFGLI